MNGNPLDTDSLSIDTRKEIPVTYPVLDRGIRSPTRHGMNPWNTILHPRAQPTTEAVVKKISKAQSPTTSRAANRIRRQKVLERQAAEEEEAALASKLKSIQSRIMTLRSIVSGYDQWQEDGTLDGVVFEF